MYVDFLFDRCWIRWSLKSIARTILEESKEMTVMFQWEHERTSQLNASNKPGLVLHKTITLMNINAEKYEKCILVMLKYLNLEIEIVCYVHLKGESYILRKRVSCLIDYVKPLWL